MPTDFVQQVDFWFVFIMLCLLVCAAWEMRERCGWGVSFMTMLVAQSVFVYVHYVVMHNN